MYDTRRSPDLLCARIKMRGNEDKTAARRERCLFLELMPTELRLMVYENLLVQDGPIPAPPQESSTPKRTVDLSILRVNPQIHDEAAAVFYSKNTIRIRSKNEGGAAAIATRYQHLVRNLSVEVLHCPDDPTLGWTKTHDESAKEELENREVSNHISSLTALLARTPNLHTLSLTITPPDQPLSKQILTALLPIKNSALPDILAALPLSAPPSLSFEFDDCYYRKRVSPCFLKDGLLLLACKVLFWKSHLRVEKAVREAEGEGLKSELLKSKGGRTDLEPLVGDGLERLMEKEREVQDLFVRV